MNIATYIGVLIGCFIAKGEFDYELFFGSCGMLGLGYYIWNLLSVFNGR